MKSLFEKNLFDDKKIVGAIAGFSESELLLVDKKCDLNALHLAARYGLSDTFFKILEITKGKGLDVGDKYLRTPIHHLAAQGKLGILKKVVQSNYSFDINARNRRGRAPLHSGAKWLQTDVVKWLSQRENIKMDLLDENGLTPFSLSYWRHYRGDVPNTQYTLHPCLQYLRDKSAQHNLQMDSSSKELSADLIKAIGLSQLLNKDKNFTPESKLSIDDCEYVVADFIKQKNYHLVVLSDLKSKDSMIVCLDKSFFALKLPLLAKRFDDVESLRLLSEDLLKSLSHSKTVSIYGASLAGFDAQMLAFYLSAKLNAKINLIAVNSPGVPLQIYHQAKESNLNIECQYVFAAQDVIFARGGRHLLHDKAKFYQAKQQSSNSLSVVNGNSFFERMLNKSLEDMRLQKLHHSISVATPLEPVDRKQIKSAVDFGGLDIISLSNNALQYALTNQLADNVKQLTDVSKTVKQEEKIDLAKERDDYSKAFELAGKSLVPFIIHEHLAHCLAYKDLSHDTSIPAWLAAGQKTQLKAYRLFHHKGLYAYVLMPEQSTQKKRVNVRLVFQGTDFSNVHSAKRDLDRGSAGYRYIRENFLSLVSGLAGLVNSHQQIALSVAGHSLGGADAQNFFASLVGMLAVVLNTKSDSSLSQQESLQLKRFAAKLTSIQQDVTAFLKKLKSVEVYAFNGAGVRRTTAQLVKASLKALSDSGINFAINHQRATHDVVNTVGETNLHDFEPALARVNYLHFVGRSERTQIYSGLFFAHTDHQFKDIKQFGKHRLLTNESSVTEIKKHLSANKVEPEANKTFNELKSLLYRL